MEKNNLIVVDGANIAYTEQSRKDQPKASNITAVRDALEARGYQPVIITDASLQYEIDDRKQQDLI